MLAEGESARIGKLLLMIPYPLDLVFADFLPSLLNIPTNGISITDGQRCQEKQSSLAPVEVSVAQAIDSGPISIDRITFPSMLLESHARPRPQRKDRRQRLPSESFTHYFFLLLVLVSVQAYT